MSHAEACRHVGSVESCADSCPKRRAGIVQGLCEGVAKYCPTAWVGIISNPVNSTVPIAAEVFKRAGAFLRTLIYVTDVPPLHANGSHSRSGLPDKDSAPSGQPKQPIRVSEVASVIGSADTT